jgi:hypothetical protein
MVSITRPAASAFLVISSLCTITGQASEGAASYYFAGGFRSFVTAVPPEPGFTAASQTLIFGGQAQRAVLRGRATSGLTAFALYEYIAGSHAFTQPVLGGCLQVGAAAPVVARSLPAACRPAASATPPSVIRKVLLRQIAILN